MNKTIALTCLLAFIVPTLPLQAGDHSHHGLYQQSDNSTGGGNSKISDSQSSVLMTAAMSAAILTMPVAFSAQGVEESTKSSGKASAESRRQRCEQPCCGQPLPEMEVQQISYNDQGQRQVVFAVAGNPQQNLVLLWLLSNDDKTLPDPAAGFAIGQKVSFQPSKQFSGCLLQDESGAPLAFVPATHRVSNDYSETF